MLVIGRRGRRGSLRRTETPARSRLSSSVTSMVAFNSAPSAPSVFSSSRIMARAISQARSGSPSTSPSGSEISSSPIRVLKKYRGIGGNLTPAEASQPEACHDISQVLYRSWQRSGAPKIAIRGAANNREMLDPTLF